MCDFHFAWDKGSERRERKKTHEFANNDREEEEEAKKGTFGFHYEYEQGR